MEMKEFGTKLDGVFAEEHPDSAVYMHFVLALWKDGSRMISQRTKEPLVEELKRFLKEVERSY